MAATSFNAAIAAERSLLTTFNAVVAAERSLLTTFNAVVAAERSVLTSFDAVVAAERSVLTSFDAVVAAERSVLTSFDAVVAAERTAVSSFTGIVAAARTAVSSFTGIVAAARTAVSSFTGNVWTDLLHDDFVDANSTLLSAHAMNVGPGWTVVAIIGSASNAVIVGNRAAINLSPGRTLVRCYADAGTANHTVTIQFSLTTTAQGWINADTRLQDASNFCFAQMDVNAKTISIWKAIAGVTTQLAVQTVGTMTTGVTYTLTLVSTATTLNATISGAGLTTVTTGNISDSTGAANTKFGMDMQRWDASSIALINVSLFKVT